MENAPVDEKSLRDRTVYLIPEFDSERGCRRILNEVWPQNRTQALFEAWSNVEVHEIVEDLCGFPLEEDKLM